VLTTPEAGAIEYDVRIYFILIRAERRTKTLASIDVRCGECVTQSVIQVQSITRGNISLNPPAAGSFEHSGTARGASSGALVYSAWDRELHQRFDQCGNDN